MCLRWGEGVLSGLFELGPYIAFPPIHRWRIQALMGEVIFISSEQQGLESTLSQLQPIGGTYT